MIGAFKPILACNADIENISNFPVYVQPKIDGVRAMNVIGTVVGRSYKIIANRFIADKYSTNEFLGLDGEMVVGNNLISHSLCRDTTSALNSHKGEPDIHWYVFDICTPHMAHLRYESRLNMLREHVDDRKLDGGYPNIHVIENHIAYNAADVISLDDMFHDTGYEGTIIRSPAGIYKHGRSTPKEGYLLKIKRYRDAEAIVIGLEQGYHNANVAQKDELGYTFRTTHQENMIPNGMVGAIIVKDLFDNREFTISAGRLSHAERKYFWENPSEILNKVVTYQYFPHGEKDKPRHPTFQKFKAAFDIDPELLL